MSRRLPALWLMLVVSLACVKAESGQTPSATELPDAIRTHLNNERLELVTSIRGLPLGVRDELQTLFGSQTLDIAEPGAAYQVTDVIATPQLPTRRLVAAGCSADHCLVYYERGGLAHVSFVMLFHWTPQATRFEWGGRAPNNLGTIDSVRTAVMSGTIKGGNTVW